MKNIDLIINALQNCSAFQPKNYYEIDKALAAARELKQEFYPDWDMIKPYHDRIAELEAQLAKREWVGLTDDEIKEILDCGRGGLVDIKKAEQILKEKNT